MRDNGKEPESLGRVKCIAQTKQALKILKGGFAKSTTFWVPLSVVHTDSVVMEDGDIGELFVERWWAEKEGLA